MSVHGVLVAFRGRWRTRWRFADARGAGIDVSRRHRGIEDPREAPLHHLSQHCWVPKFLVERLDEAPGWVSSQLGKRLPNAGIGEYALAEASELAVLHGL